MTCMKEIAKLAVERVWGGAGSEVNCVSPYAWFHKCSYADNYRNYALFP